MLLEIYQNYLREHGVEDEHIAKPVDVKLLLKTIYQLVENSQQ